ncbi:MAG: energy-coupling factor ABC transporter permease [Gallionellaceae bacterium]|nr:energy-coupling factor ABC transporter permease [Gallionellaceae bacterium]
MHIEPGIIAQAKILAANVGAAGLLLAYTKDLIKNPADIVRMLVAAVFFSLFMQGFFVKVGPSELHFVGAMVIYLTLGFVPTLIGFAVGLLLQGVLFDPLDLPHLAVNSLSLIVPLIAVHYTLGRKLREQDSVITWKNILKLDAMYYSGVTIMVGFWLAMSNVATSFTAWATFASSYLALVACEPLLTYSALRLLKRHEDSKIVDICFAVKSLKLAN